MTRPYHQENWNSETDGWNDVWPKWETAKLNPRELQIADSFC